MTAKWKRNYVRGVVTLTMVVDEEIDTVVGSDDFDTLRDRIYERVEDELINAGIEADIEKIEMDVR